jgi:hypothetical protein
MKNKLFMIFLAILLMANGMMAQNRFSIGLVGTRFENLGDGQKLTQIDVPFGYGVVLGYAVNKDISVGFTGEYFKSDMKNFAGEERDLRAHVSAYFTPFPSQTVRPYLSAGLVYTNRNSTYTLTNLEETKGLLDGRFGVGLDYNILQNVYLNFDAGLYSDGLNIVGWSSSVGLRLSPRIF